MKSIYEFLVWDNCSNNCQFCWQRETPRIFDHTQREIILQEVLNFINSDKFVKGSHVLICGGEIFDKPSDFFILNKFFECIVDLMKNNVIDLLYINTNLIYLNINGLYEFLELIKNNNLLDRLKFTSSYDIQGRFKNEHDRQVMLTNLKSINQYNINIVVNTILTKPCCEAILNGNFDLKKFMEEYRCWVNLVPYIVLDKELTAERSTIFKALKYVDNTCPGYLDKYIPNICIKQEKLLYKFEDGEFKFCSCDIAECGHSINFRRYSKEGTCFCCDVEHLFKE